MGFITHKIEKRIEAEGITKTAFALKIGVSRDTVYNWTDESIKFSTLLKVCEVLKMQIEDFIELPKEVNEPKPGYTKGKITRMQLDPTDKITIDLRQKVLEITAKEV